jgi:hypothetical protein
MRNPGRQEKTRTQSSWFPAFLMVCIPVVGGRRRMAPLCFTSRPRGEVGRRPGEGAGCTPWMGLGPPVVNSDVTRRFEPRKALHLTEEDRGSSLSTPTAVDTPPKRQRGPPRAVRGIGIRSSLTLRVSMAPGRAESLVSFSALSPSLPSLVRSLFILLRFFCALAPWREVRSFLLIAPERCKLDASLRTSGREAHAKPQSRKRDRSR